MRSYRLFPCFETKNDDKTVFLFLYFVFNTKQFWAVFGPGPAMGRGPIGVGRAVVGRLGTETFWAVAGAGRLQKYLGRPPLDLMYY